MPQYRRLACQLATQLPENREEARIVVAHLERLVEGFLYERSSGLAARPVLINPEGRGSVTEAFFGRLADVAR
jgi:hypothetical protein